MIRNPLQWFLDIINDDANRPPKATRQERIQMTAIAVLTAIGLGLLTYVVWTATNSAKAYGALV